MLHQQKKIKGSEAGNFVSLDPIIDNINDYDAWYYSVESVDWSKYCVPVKLPKENIDEIMAEIRQEMEAEKIYISVKHSQKHFD